MSLQMSRTQVSSAPRFSEQCAARAEGVGDLGGVAKRVHIESGRTPPLTGWANLLTSLNFKFLLYDTPT